VPDPPADDLQRLLFTASDEPSVSPEPTPGAVAALPSGFVIDQYVVEGVLGRGGMGVVYTAHDPRSGRRVALKLAGPEAAGDSRNAERARREGVAAAALNHPGVVRVHAAGAFQDRPYLVFELVEGAQHLLEAAAGRPLVERVQLLREAACALGHAHGKGVVHRDVKSENLLVDTAGRVRVADFGLAAMATAGARLTRSGALVGTPVSMAPEQVDGSGAVGPPTDVWALGVVLYELLTGRRPFEAESLVHLAAQVLQSDPERPSALDTTIPPALDRVVAKALAKDPADRYPDGDAVARALDEALAAPFRGGGPTRAQVGLALVAFAVGAGGLAAWGSTGGSGAAEAPTPHASIAVDPLDAARQALVDLEQDHPGESAIAAAEEALWTLFQAGDPVDPGRLAGLDDGPARLRVRTLALLLAGAPDRARQELAGARGTLAVQLGQLVDVALGAQSITFSEDRRGWVNDTSLEGLADSDLLPTQRAVTRLLEALEASERLPAGPGLEGIRRWALPACQDGLAKLAVIARDQQADVGRRVGNWFPRALALAPESEAVPRLWVAHAWAQRVAGDRWEAERPDLQRELAKLGDVEPEVFAFLAATMLGEPGDTEQQLAKLGEALRIGREDAAIKRRYRRLISRLRVDFASASLDRAWTRVAGGLAGRDQALQAAYQAAWVAAIQGEHSTAPTLGELSAQLVGHTLPAGARLSGAADGSRVLVLVLLMLRQPEAARVTLGRLAATDRRVQALVGAEVLWLERGLEPARARLEAICVDPRDTSSAAWLALAHARSLDGDEQGVAAALKQAEGSEALPFDDVPWHTADHFEALRAGHGWWPGRPD